MNQACLKAALLFYQCLSCAIGQGLVAKLSLEFKSNQGYNLSLIFSLLDSYFGSTLKSLPDVVTTVPAVNLWAVLLVGIFFLTLERKHHFSVIIDF